MQITKVNLHAMILKIISIGSHKNKHAHTHNHLMALCLGLPRSAGTRINIHPLTRRRKRICRDIQTTKSIAWELIPITVLLASESC